MRIFRLMLGLFITLIIFQVNSIFIYANKNEIGVISETILESAKEMKRNTIRIMENGADLKKDYDIGNKCIITTQDGFVRVLKFPSEKLTSQPPMSQSRDRYEKSLFNELLSHNGNLIEIHGEDDGMIYYISLAKTSNKNCYVCHGESETFEKFGAVGVISIRIPTNW